MSLSVQQIEIDPPEHKMNSLVISNSDIEFSISFTDFEDAMEKIAKIISEDEKPRYPKLESAYFMP